VAMDSGERKVRVRSRDRADWIVVRRARFAFSDSRASRSARRPVKGFGGESSDSLSALGWRGLVVEVQFWWREVLENRVWQARIGWER